jgi:hypothetical protein
MSLRNLVASSHESYEQAVKDERETCPQPNNLSLNLNRYTSNHLHIISLGKTKVSLTPTKVHRVNMPSIRINVIINTQLYQFYIQDVEILI